MTLPALSPDDLKAARHALGWSLRQMAGALGLERPEDKGADRLREMEDGRRPLSGPVKLRLRPFRAPHAPLTASGIWVTLQNA